MRNIKVKDGKHIWITADTHLAVSERHCRERGFRTQEEHDNYIISQWNSVVGPSDIVYHLGDLVDNKKTISVVKPHTTKVACFL